MFEKFHNIMSEKFFKIKAGMQRRVTWAVRGVETTASRELEKLGVSGLGKKKVRKRNIFYSAHLGVNYIFQPQRTNRGL